MPEPSADPTSASWVQTTTKAISRGDRAALAAFYEVWFDRCYALARSLTGRDEAFCLDVVQNTMLRVIRSLKQLPTHAELSAWMTRTTHTAALDLLRRESRRLKREIGMVHIPEPAKTEADDRIVWLRGRLNELPNGDGSLVALRIAQEQSLNAVGAASGMTGDAAHGRIRRAVHKLKREVKEGDHEQ